MKFKKLDGFTGTQKCVFCETNYIDELKYGSIYAFEDIITHYFCVLLSSNMEQNGLDDEGILGFLPNDIRKEVRRGKKLRCNYCRKTGATLGCSVAKCRMVFHLPCGLTKGSLHQFYGHFKSFCIVHRPRQKLEKIVEKLKGNLDATTCSICYDDLVLNSDTAMWAPCCQKNAFFHRECVQKLANSFGGYAFRCPLCNEKDIFTKTMKDFGIFVPERDASWEQETNAYHDLLYRHDRCDAQKCICPHGRKYNKKTSKWYIMLCQLCGSQGIHHACLFKKTTDWQCDACLTMLVNAEHSSSSENENDNSTSLSTSLEAASVGHSRIRIQETSSRRSSEPCTSINRPLAAATSSTVTSGQYLSNKKEKITSESSSSTSPSPTLSICHKKKKLKRLASSHRSREKSRSRSSNSSSRSRLRTSSTSSSSVVSVISSLSPVIVIDSDDDDVSSDDVEVVCDVSRNILVNRDGNKIQIVQIGNKIQSFESDCIEIQGDIKVKDVDIDCGIKMPHQNEVKLEMPESGSMKKRKMNISHSEFSDTSASSPMSNSLPASYSPYMNVKNYNVGDNRGEDCTIVSNVPATLKIVSNISVNNNNRLNNSPVSEMARVPSATIIKIRDKKPKVEVEDKTISPVVEPVVGPTTKLKPAGTVTKCTAVRGYVQYSPAEFANGYSSYDKYAAFGKHAVRNHQRASRKAFTRSVNKPGHHNIRLKELSVVLEPLVLKAMKNGSIKVIQRRSRPDCGMLPITKFYPSDYSVDSNVNKRNSKNSNESDRLLKGLLNKVIKNKGNTFLKSVYTNMVRNKDRIGSVVCSGGDRKSKGKSRKTKSKGKRNKTDDSLNNENNCNVDDDAKNTDTNNKRRKRVTFKQDANKQQGLSDKSNLIVSDCIISNNKTKDKLKNSLHGGDFILNQCKTVCSNNTSKLEITDSRKLKQTTLFDIFNSKNSLANKISSGESNRSIGITELNNNLKRRRKVRNSMRKERSHKRLKTEDNKLSVHKESSSVICDICKSKITPSTSFKRLCCLINHNKFVAKSSKLSNDNGSDRSNVKFFDKFKMKEVSSASLNDFKSSNLSNKIGSSKGTDDVRNVVNSDVSKIFSNNVTTTSPVKNKEDIIFIQQINVIQLTPNNDSSPSNLLSDANYLNYIKNRFGKQVDLESNNIKLFSMVNFPCSDFHLLHSPQFLKFTTFPVNKTTVNNVIKSCIKIEIKKCAMFNNDSFYQFFMYINEIPVVLIKVLLNKDVVRDNKSSDTKSVCYHFNKHCNSFNDPDGNGLSNLNLLDDDGLFFILPSVVTFNDCESNNNVRLELLLKVIKNNDAIAKPKTCSFQVNLNESFTEINNKDGTNKSTNDSINKNLAIDNDRSFNECFSSEKNSKSSFIAPIFNNNCTNNLKFGVADGSQFQSFYCEPIHDLQSTYESFNLSDKQNKFMNGLSKYKSIYNNSSPEIVNRNKKRKFIISNSIFKSNKQKSVSNCKTVESQNSLSESTQSNPSSSKSINHPVIPLNNGKFGFNVQNYERLKTTIRDHDYDNTLFRYVKQASDNFIRNSIGYDFKQSLIEKLISSFKK